VTEAFDTWLNQAEAQLDELLDVEAGLREILLQSDHDERVEGLHGVVDEEAGLSAILEPTPTPADGIPLFKDQAIDGETAQPNLQLLTATERMRLRSVPAVAEAADYLELLETVVDVLSRPVSRITSGNGGYQTLELVSSVVSKIADLLHSHNRYDLYLQQAEACLANFPKTGETFAVEVNRPQFNQAALRALISALRLAERAFVWSQQGDQSTRDEWRLNVEAETVLNGVRNVRNLLIHGADGPARFRTSNHRSFAVHEADRVLKACGESLRFTIEGLVGRRVRLFDAALLRFMLDDFTTTDLSEADFHDVDMTGMRWTEHGTRWPTAITVADLKQVSVEEPEGSGVYVITFGTSSVFPILVGH
jgi:hypothetical protein